MRCLVDGSRHPQLWEIAITGFFAAQRFGGAMLIDRALMALAKKLGWASLGNLASLHDDLLQIYADSPRLAVAVLVARQRLGSLARSKFWWHCT